MAKMNASANALKSELHVRSRALEMSTEGEGIRTICRISVEWAPELPDKICAKLDRTYADALDDIRNILSFR